jgi:hypothetical protein
MFQALDKLSYYKDLRCTKYVVLDLHVLFMVLDNLSTHVRLSSFILQHWLQRKQA